MHSDTFLKPEHVAPVRNLTLRAKLIVEGMIAGLHRSPYHGFSAEFSEYRSYQQGESTRLIDWRKFAKSDRAVVKLHDDETNLCASILIDKSASMGFVSQSIMSKFDYARTLAASIAWILIRQRDAVALAAFDQKIGAYLPPRSTNLQLQNIIASLDALTPSSSTSCGESINMLALQTQRRGLTVVISDFLDDPDKIFHGLRHLRFKKQDVLCIWILDEKEQSLSEKTVYRLSDLEDGRTLTLDGRTAAASLHDGFTRHKETLSSGCRELGFDFCTIVTNEPFVNALMRVLASRGRTR